MLELHGPVNNFFPVNVCADIAGPIGTAVVFGGGVLLAFGSTGVLLFSIGFLILLTTLFVKIRDSNFPALTSIMLAAVFALGGLISFMMGFLAELMLRIYYETKATRPYVIKEIRENKYGG